METIVILFIILLIFIFTTNNSENYADVNPDAPTFINFYNKKFTNNENKYNNILLLGFITSKTLDYFQTKFPDSYIFVINQDNKIDYTIDLNTNTKIIKENPYDPTFINTYFISQNILFDMVVVEGLISIDNIKSFITNYISLLSDTSMLIIENLQSYTDVNSIINLLPLNIKTPIEIIDYRRILNKYDTILLCLDKTNIF